MKNLKCTGFEAAGISAGLKKHGKKDLGLIFSKVPASVAGVFTKNQVQAAPVLMDKERIKSGICQAVIVNSKNANCCTGDRGMRDAEAMAKAAADNLGISENSVLAASTGVIGEPFPIDKVKAAVPYLTEAISPEGFSDLAEAIMTTDTVPKTATIKKNLGGKIFTVTAVAKGAGMIRPDMATMLCFVCTDIKATPKILKETLINAVNISFNRITIDGDTSTNDTVLLMANGLSGAVVETDDQKRIFQEVINKLLLNMAKQLVKDGEGVTKLVEVMVKGAASDMDAGKTADAVANSPLVKTAFFGEDVNWGRIMGAVGRSGAKIDPDLIDIYFNNVQMVKSCMGCGRAAEIEAAKVLKKDEFKVVINLNTGSGSASVLTCDFSVDYVKINADYRS